MINHELSQLSDRILEFIRRRPDHFYSISGITRRLDCSVADFTEATNLLREIGYKIKFQKKEKCAFTSAPDLLLSAEIKQGLKTKFIGQTVYSFKSVQSTNTIASRLADTHATKGTLPHGQVPEGTIIVSEAQTKGRGRLGRSWYSPEGAGIYVSIILYPDIIPAKAPGLSLLTALSLAGTLASLDDMKVRIKWPNDCLLNGRKAAGILTELSAEIGRVHHVIIGVGINVNQTRRDFPAAVSKTATSIRIELKKEIRRVEFLQKFLKNFEADYLHFRKSGFKWLRKKILTYSNLIGKNIKLDMQGSVISGKAVDIDDNGSLVLEIAGQRQAFSSGEVTVIKSRQ